MSPINPTLTLTVQPTYLTDLRTGLKTHEGRLARPQYLSLQRGNYIAIRSTRPIQSEPVPTAQEDTDPASHKNTNPDAHKSTTLPPTAQEDSSIFQIHSITQYKTFREMLLAHGVAAFLPGVEDLDEAVAVYRAFPGYEEGEREVGVVAVGVVLVG